MFHDLIDPVLEDLPAGVIKHAANSGGTFFTSDDDLDMIRPGLALYGIDPSLGMSSGGEKTPEVTGEMHTELRRQLRPVAKWTAPLLSVRDVPAGGSVGYGRTWIAKKPTRVGLIPVGYADGYRRIWGNRAVVRVPAVASEHGQTGDAFCDVIGRVSMDYITVDLTPAPWAEPGDEITLLDDEPKSLCSAANLAELAGTIPYEIFCNIGPRVARVMVNPTDGETA